jgi:hypothetical protein
VQTLVPLSWLEQHHATVGGDIYLSNVVDLAEMGVPEGLIGTIVSIGDCPAIESGPGRVVLTTVSHSNDFVYTLTLTDPDGQADVLGITGWHKVYSEDRGWVSAKDLVEGEVVRTADGYAVVTGLVRDPGTFRVYNMTVESDHVYYVGDLTALVHNNGCKPGTPEWEQAWSLRRLSIDLANQADESLLTALQLTREAENLTDPVLLRAYEKQIELWFDHSTTLRARANELTELFNRLTGG